MDRFALVDEKGTVVRVIGITGEESIEAQAMAAAFKSDFKIVEVDPSNPAEFGWTFDGENYIPPEKD